MTNFGDAEAAVVDILDAAGLDAGISTDLVGYAEPARWLTVSREGGAPTLWMHLDNPVIRIESRAADKGAALDLAIAARSAVFAARGQYAGHGLSLYDVVDEGSGLAWSPDEQSPNIARYVFDLTLVTRPEAA